MQHHESGYERSVIRHDELILGRRKLKSIFRNSIPHVLEAGMSLTTASLSDGIYHLRSGWAHQFLDWSVNRRAIVDVYLPGDVVGLDTIVRSQPPKALALTSVTIEVIPTQQLMNLLADRPTALYITWLLGQRQQRADRLLAAMAGLDARGRLAMMLLDFYTRLSRRKLITGLTYNLPLTRVQIGNYLGLTVVHINRVLRALHDKRVVGLEKHCVTILDLPQLISLARTGEVVSSAPDAAERALQEATGRLAGPDRVVGTTVGARLTNNFPIRGARPERAGSNPTLQDSQVCTNT